jgi:spermidine synthase
MTLLPNETNTTKYAIDRSKGKVLTYGLGLGYFTYMASLKDDVESVCVVERSPDVIELFKQFILPQFKYPEKVNIVECDAFEFAEKHMKDGCYNTVFTDIWHDPSDGCELYLRMKKYEYLLPDAEFIYWVENTLKLYL